MTKPKVYIIAEAALSHMGKIEYAASMIDYAYDAGCDCIKFQVYKTDELIDKDRDSERYEEFKSRELTYRDFKDCKRYCESVGIDFLATPHTVGAFHFLEEIGVKRFKIGSGDRGEILELAKKSGKPIILSTGMRDKYAVYSLIMNNLGFDITYMHCITQYPVTDETANLGFMRNLDGIVNKWGYSDHYPGTYACELAVAMGAQVIEKHIRLPESEGQDNSCAIMCSDLPEFVQKLRRVEKIVGSTDRIYSEAEKANESWALKGKNGKRPL